MFSPRRRLCAARGPADPNARVRVSPAGLAAWAAVDRLRRPIAPLLTGALLAFSMPPWGWWPLAFVAFAILERLVVNAPSRRRRYWVGFWFGFGWLFPATFWMIALTAPGYVVQGLIFSALFGLATAVTPASRWRWLALPAAFTLVEALRWRWPFGGVPLATLPMSQHAGPLGETVRLMGPLLLASIVVAGGMAIAAIGRHAHRVGGAIVVGIVAIALIAQVAPNGSPVRDLEVAIVQGGGPQGTRAINTDEREVFERHLTASRTLLGDSDADAFGGAVVQRGDAERIAASKDLVLWPEDVVNVRRLIEDAPEYAELQDHARELDAWFIAGIFEKTSDTTNSNGSIAFAPDGAAVDRYNKVRLVPFGEFVPLRSLIEPLAPDYLPRRDTEPGDGDAATLDIEIDGEPVTLGISISWEIFFEDRARDAIGNGGDILINPTNGSSYWLTILQTQQVASSRLRAMETGRFVLQAAPTGFSAVVDPDGNLLLRTSVSEASVLHANVELRTGQTLATRLGAWPMRLLAAAALATAITADRRREP